MYIQTESVLFLVICILHVKCCAISMHPESIFKLNSESTKQWTQPHWLSVQFWCLQHHRKRLLWWAGANTGRLAIRPSKCNHLDTVKRDMDRFWPERQYTGCPLIWLFVDDHFLSLWQLLVIVLSSLKSRETMLRVISNSATTLVTHRPPSSFRQFDLW